MLLSQLDTVHLVVIATVATTAIREYGRTRRAEIGKTAESRHRAEIIRAASGPWWRRR